MRFYLSVFLIVFAASCVSAEGEVVSQKHFEKVCNAELDDYVDCEKLHGKMVSLKGSLYYPIDKNKIARLFTLETNVPSHDDDELWDLMPIDGPQETTLILSDSPPEDILENLKRLHQKNVKVDGRINTECLTKQRQAEVQSNEADENGDMTIILLTGICHYYGAYIYDFTISELTP